MTTLLWVVVGAYAVGAAVFARMIAGHRAWKWKSQFDARPGAFDWFAGWGVGVLGGWLWLPYLVLGRLPRLRLPAIGAEREARSHEQGTRIEEAQQRIAELERDTGLSPDPPEGAGRTEGADT